VDEGGGNGGLDGGRERSMKPWADMAAAVIRTRSAQWCRCSDCVVDGWAHTVLYFPKLSKLAQHMEIENGCLTVLQKLPIFASARLGH
jgi:hypothetical protein